MWILPKNYPLSSHFVQDMVESKEDLTLPGLNIESSLMLKSKPSALPTWLRRWKPASYLPHLFTRILKTFPSEIFRDRVDLITGGYPCQPFSAAGKRLGEDDPRHLWPHIRKHIEAIRPVQCFFENVEGHISLGLSSVISDLEEDGYRSAWGIFSAREVGAPHQRKRVYIMANSNNTRFGQSKQANETQSSKRLDSGSVSQRKNVAYTDSALGTGRGVPSGVHKEHADVDSGSNASRGLATFKWPTEPRVGRVVDGGSYRVDRLRMLGNGVVPQTAAKAYITLRERFA